MLDVTEKFPFIHLRLHTAYSLAEGAVKIKDVPRLCKEAGTPAVAMTDTNNLFGAPEFSETLCSAGVQPIIGLTCNLDLNPIYDKYRKEAVRLSPVVLLVKDQIGWMNAMKLSGLSYENQEKAGKPHLSVEELTARHEGLILLTGGYDGAIGRLFHDSKQKEAEELILRLQGAFGDRLYIELQRFQMPNEKEFERFQLKIAYQHHIAIVATNDIMFKSREDHPAHDALLCIAEGRYLSEENRRRVSEERYFKSASEMLALFADLPEATTNTIEIAKRCAFRTPNTAPILPRFLPDGGIEEEAEELRRQARKGLKTRLDHGEMFAPREDYEKRLEFELDVIITMGFPGYFLIVADFIQYAKSQNIPVGPGRGSGAGSVAAWALTITDLDPLRFGLLFERFLNPERVSMPDFDIDFCQERREEVIEYVRTRYGKDRVAQIITFGKLQARAVLRDVGRVLQMPYNQVDRLCKLVPNNPANPVTLEQALQTEEALAVARRQDETVSYMLDVALKLEGLYRHASTHAAGVVIADRPLDEITPPYRDPRSDMPVTQYNMKWVETSGLVKFDFLGLKTLTVLQRTCDLLRARGVEIDLTKLPFDNRKTFDLLGQGDSGGVFQLESAGMRDVLRKMKPDCIEDIIALVALYRPGPMDNIPKYIAAKKGTEKPDYLHPMLTQILKETYGVIIYQEQVMQIAQVMAGYSLGEADLLRRAMGKKIKEEMDQQRERFVKGALANRVEQEKAASVFDLVAKFAGYGFNKSHAAAYALISYQTGYMKANYPLEFMSSILTFDMHNPDKLSAGKRELDKMKIKLVPPCVNQSFTDFTPDGDKILFALAAIKNVGTGVTKAIEKERKERGAYQDLYDFARRVDPSVMNKRVLENLARSGAFDCLNINRRQSLESIDVLSAESVNATTANVTGQVGLFSGGGKKTNPPLKAVPDFPALSRLAEEYAALGFYMSSHPLESTRSALAQSGVITYEELRKHAERGDTRATLAGVVTGKQERRSAKGNKFAFVQLSDLSASYEVTVFSDTLFNFGHLLQAGQTVILNVEAESDGEQMRVRVNRIRSPDDLSQSGGAGYRIYISDPEAIPNLREILSRPGTGEIKIAVCLEELDAEAIVKLPGKYLFGPGHIAKLGETSGVLKIEEI